MTNFPTGARFLLTILAITIGTLFPGASIEPAQASLPVSTLKGDTSSATPFSSAQYRIDASQSRFIVRAFAGGFLSALAHDHTIAIRDFTGETQFTYGTVD